MTFYVPSQHCHGFLNSMSQNMNCKIKIADSFLIHMMNISHFIILKNTPQCLCLAEGLTSTLQVTESNPDSYQHEESFFTNGFAKCLLYLAPKDHCSHLSLSTKGFRITLGHRRNAAHLKAFPGSQFPEISRNEVKSIKNLQITNLHTLYTSCGFLSAIY